MDINSGFQCFKFDYIGNSLLVRIQHGARICPDLGLGDFDFHVFGYQRDKDTAVCNYDKKDGTDEISFYERNQQVVKISE